MFLSSVAPCRRLLQAVLNPIPAIAALLLAVFAGTALAQNSTCTVSSTADTGAGTLRACLSQIPQGALTYTVNFSIPSLSVIPVATPLVLDLTGTSATQISVVGLAGGGVTLSGGGQTQILRLVGNPLATSGVSLSNLTLVNGSADLGGALYFASNASLIVQNSTFSGNFASTGGSAVYVGANVPSATISNSTFSGNTGSGGTILTNGSTGNLFQTTVASNGSGVLAQASLPLGPFSVTKSVISGNGTGTQCTGCSTDGTDYLGNAPMLGPLQLNGSLLATMLPQPGSPTIGMAGLTSADERGFPGKNAGDAGAVQTHYVTVTRADDASPYDGGTDPGQCADSQVVSNCSLRQAVTYADAYGPAEITFAPSLTANATTANPTIITLGGAELYPLIGAMIDVAGPGANLLQISGGGKSRIFEIPDAGNLALNGVTLTQGGGTEGPTQLDGQDGAYDGVGGAIFSAGVTTLTGSALTASSAAAYGGGIAAYNIDNNCSGCDANVLVLSHSTISGNSASQGGGLWVDNVSLLISDSTISGNTGTGAGLTLVSATSAVTEVIAGTTISGNSPFGNGISLETENNPPLFVNDILDEGVTSVCIGDCDQLGGGNLVNFSGSVNTMLAPLAYNGGTTQTMLPLPGSPALCTGTSAVGYQYGTTADQRGATHSPAYCSSGQLDAGAVQTSYSALSFVQQPSAGVVNAPITPAVTVAVTEDNANAANIPVPLTLTTSGAGTLAGTSTQTSTPVANGPALATYTDLSVTQPATSDTLGATLNIAPGFSLSAMSDSFVETGSPSAANSTIVLGPASLTVGDTASLTVTVLDSAGTPVPNVVVTVDVQNVRVSSESEITTNGSGLAVLQIALPSPGTISATAYLPVKVQIGYTQALPISALAPALSFTVPNQTFGAAPFTVAATSNSQGAFTYSVLSGPATIQGSTVTLTGTGTVKLQAWQAAAGNYAIGTSAAVFAVNPATTSTSLVGSINTGTTNATLIATISPSVAGTYPTAPGGTVTFYDNGAAIGSASLSGGKASLITTAGYTGTQAFTSAYNGDANYSVSPRSNTVSLNFTTPPAITFAPGASYAFGQSFQLAATSNSTGAFTYKVVSGPATVSASGAGTVTGEGTVVFEADQVAATGYSAGSKQARLTAVQASSGSVLAAALVPSGTGFAATLAVTVSPQYSGIPTGSVTFYDGSTSLVTVALTGGKATYNTGQLSATPHTFSAVYLGDANFTTSSSNKVVLTPASKPAPTVTLHLASTRLVYPEPPAFEIQVATLSGKPSPTGTVTLYDGARLLAKYSLTAASKGNVVGIVPPLSVGPHALQAVYSGDAIYATGSSATAAVTVTPGPVKLNLSCAHTSLTLGQALSCTVRGTEIILPVTGTVNYSFSNGVSGSVLLNAAGRATITYVPSIAGSYTLTTTYAAQGNYQAASPTSIPFTVN